jgi:hypothetical protein
MEVKHLEAVAEAVLRQHFERLQHLADLQSKLRQLTAPLLPFAAAAGEELHTNAQQRFDAHLFDDPNDPRQFPQIFEDEDDDFSQHSSVEGQLDKVLVLETIADQQRVRIIM